jgi:hypothetical protein
MSLEVPAQLVDLCAPLVDFDEIRRPLGIQFNEEPELVAVYVVLSSGEPPRCSMRSSEGFQFSSIGILRSPAVLLFLHLDSDQVIWRPTTPSAAGYSRFRQAANSKQSKNATGGFRVAENAPGTQGLKAVGQLEFVLQDERCVPTTSSLLAPDRIIYHRSKMIALICCCLRLFTLRLKSKMRLAENTILRHQLIVLERKIRECDFALYCERNLVEQFFSKSKHFRGICHTMTGSPKIFRAQFS